MKKNNYDDNIISNNIKNYTSKNKSFHMPGHKSGKIAPIDNLFSIDVTEVDGTDDLHHPSSFIKDVHNKISTIYGSIESRMLVGGSTSGLLAGITSGCQPGDEILISRNCHKSVYNGLMLNQLKVHYLYPEYDHKYYLYGQVNPQDIQLQLEANPKIKLVVITSPTYEGLVSDIKEISTIVHEAGALLMVDEAHGAHFVYSDLLPDSAISLGADIVVQSTHKTLPSLTQTGILHVGSQALNIRRLDQCLAIYQTSSPSYVLMSSIESGIDYMNKSRKAYGHLLEDIKKVYDIDMCGGSFMYSSKQDLSRLTFLIDSPYITGFELSDELRKRFNIQVEMAGLKSLVAITSIADEIKDIHELINCINIIMEASIGEEEDELQVHSTMDRKNQPLQVVDMSPPQSALSIHESFYAKLISINLKESIGRSAGEFIIPYPPGIPMLTPGEIIEERHIIYINKLLEFGLEIYGIIDGEISILE